MNKREAQKLADKGGYRVKDLRAVITASDGMREMSLVNPAIPHARARQIYTDALHGRDDDEELKAWVLDVYTNRMRRSRDNLIVRNILRDCLA